MTSSFETPDPPTRAETPASFLAAFGIGVAVAFVSILLTGITVALSASSGGDGSIATPLVAVSVFLSALFSARARPRSWVGLASAMAGLWLFFILVVLPAAGPMPANAVIVVVAVVACSLCAILGAWIGRRSSRRL